VQKLTLMLFFLKKLISGDPPDDWEALLEFSEDLDQDS
jgi:hypothetical protein